MPGYFIGGMNSLSRIGLIAGVLLCSGAMALAGTKNLIYKGSLVTVDLLTGKTGIAVDTYLVLGEETSLDSSFDTYTKLSGATIVVAGHVGGMHIPKKHYQVQPAGTFRSFEMSVEADGKTRTREVFTQGTDGTGTSGSSPMHSLSCLLLAGKHPVSVHEAALYDAPLHLKVTGAQSDGTATNDGDAPTGTALRSTGGFHLIKSLTDPVPNNETLDATVKRVTDYLDGQGYKPVAP